MVANWIWIFGANGYYIDSFVVVGLGGHGVVETLDFVGDGFDWLFVVDRGVNIKGDFGVGRFEELLPSGYTPFVIVVVFFGFDVFVID